MGLFSKEPCVFCGTPVGFFSRKKLVNKEGVICKNCELKTSVHINVGRFTKDELEKHIKYMERQNEIYEKAFITLDKSDLDDYKCIDTGIQFADKIAMFRYISPKADKRDYKELFRYNQIRDYQPYAELNTNNQGGNKYSEVGLTIYLNSSYDEHGTSMNKELEGARNFHPYVRELRIPRHRNVDSELINDPLVKKLDTLFGIYVDNSVFGAVKESFVGTQKERQQIKAGVDSLKALGNMAKAKITGNADDAAKAKESFETAKSEVFDTATGNRATYTKIANDVEDQILGKE